MENTGSASHINRTMGQASSELEGRIIEGMKKVYDPEIPINIYDLGLIYEIQIDAEKKAKILMTLTSPNCPAAGVLPGQVEAAVRQAEGVTDAEVEIVWEPQWGREMMSEAAALDLGLL
jgi:FeS assembly SUF system protein